MLVNVMAISQDSLLAAKVAIIRCYEAKRAVQVHGIVPGDEPINSGLLLFQTFKSAGKILRPVF